jgi:hypothetical protein
LLADKAQMLSIMPKNKMPRTFSLESAIIQPARYAWELTLPKGWLRRPPVLSTCWLITTEFLKQAGGFQAVANTTAIEGYFARSADAQRYRFRQSNKSIGLESHKGVSEQRSTAIRTRYPQTHRRPEDVAALAFTQLVILFVPYVLFIASLFEHSWIALALSAINIVLLTLLYSQIVQTTFQHFLFRSLWVLPFAALYDAFILQYSMWRYEFREVIWKGRNVCIPIMQYGDEAHLL